RAHAGLAAAAARRRGRTGPAGARPGGVRGTGRARPRPAGGVERRRGPLAVAAGMARARQRPAPLRPADPPLTGTPTLCGVGIARADAAHTTAAVASTALLTDHYELTMLQAALHSGAATRRCVFEVFGRRLPDGRRYGVVAGTGRLLE